MFLCWLSWHTPSLWQEWGMNQVRSYAFSLPHHPWPTSRTSRAVIAYQVMCYKNSYRSAVHFHSSSTKEAKRPHHLLLTPLPELHTTFKILWLPSAMSFLSCYKNQACVTNPHERSCHFILSKDPAAQVQNSIRISTRLEKELPNFFYFEELFPLVSVIK